MSNLSTRMELGTAVRAGDIGPFVEEINSFIKKYQSTGKTILKTIVFGPTYTIATAMAVKEIQKQEGLEETGEFDQKTFSAIKDKVKDLMSDVIVDVTEGALNAATSDIESEASSYLSFFNTTNEKDTRINGKDIIIQIGSVKKVIKDVYYRSVGVQVDASGNPISENYEFIAKDVIESDEPTDANKKDKTEPYSFDTQYQFNFGKTK